MDYIYKHGFLGGHWADVQLTFFQDALKLHRIVLAQSPYLAQHLGGPGLTVHLSFQDDGVTSEAVFACIHHLYSPAPHLVNQDNCRSMLVTALLFDIPELVEKAYEIASGAIAADVLGWVAWLGESGYVGQPDEWEGGRYGEWSARLKQDVVDYLSSTSPDVTTFAQLPYPLLKKVLESASLEFPSMQARFAFAKQVIAARKKTTTAQGLEEAAVLAATNGAGIGVQITRRSRKKLWKVEG